MIVSFFLILLSLIKTPRKLEYYFQKMIFFHFTRSLQFAFVRFWLKRACANALLFSLDVYTFSLNKNQINGLCCLLRSHFIWETFITIVLRYLLVHFLNVGDYEKNHWFSTISFLSSALSFVVSFCWHRTQAKRPTHEFRCVNKRMNENMKLKSFQFRKWNFLSVDVALTHTHTPNVLASIENENENGFQFGVDNKGIGSIINVIT